jgi:hypothetical protein
MSLLTYEESRPWATAIKLRVQSHQMPPWDIVKTVGIQHFENDRSLSDEQNRHHRAMGRRRRVEG